MKKYEIEIDAKLLDGWMPVALRKPRIGEYYISSIANEILPRLACEEICFLTSKLIVERSGRSGNLGGNI